MIKPSSAVATATPLFYRDEELAVLDLPARPLRVLRGIGSGLARRHGDPETCFWAIGDRGPNVKVKVAVERFGLTDLDRHGEADGAKIMPCLAIGPALSELRIEGDRVVLVRSLPLRDAAGAALSGLPTPGGPNAATEPAIALDGSVIAPDPSGADTEGLAARSDGSFLVGEEYGPSLLDVAADGRVRARWVPAGLEPLFAGAGYPIAGVLPAIAARRHLNRGFEALALSADEAWLYLAFQSPLAHPDKKAHRRARHVRLWQIDARTGAVAAQFLYPLDPPSSFRRDAAEGSIERSDIKISELVWLGEDRLLILERGSATTKLYSVRLDAACRLPEAHLRVETTPTVEELSARGKLERQLPVLGKTLVVSTDDLPEVDGDLEGLILLSSRSLILVNDNDFGVEGVETRFWRIDLAADI